MTGRRPALHVTSRTHAAAFTLYLLIFVLGMRHVSGVTNLSPLEDLLGASITRAWAAWHLPASMACLIGAVVASRSRNPSLGMWVEFAGALSAGLLQAVLFTALVADEGWWWDASRPTAQVIFLFLGAGMLLTAAQIVREQKKIKKARQRVRLANQPLVAEAGGDGE
jgi:hypothetical protein